MKIQLNVKYQKDDIVASELFFRQKERDLLPKEIVLAVDEDGFTFDYENINKLHFDNSGRFFVNPEESKKQINKVISDILNGNEIKPVIINAKGEILDGQHRMCAFNALGITNIPIFKSLMNETIYDNQSTRRIKLDIPFEDDFFTINDLEKNIDYKNFIANNIKSFLNNKSTKRKFKHN